MQQTLQENLLAATGVSKPIIFYDDVCVMCNGFVNFMLTIDRSQQFLFAPLGGETSRKVLPPLPEDPGQWSMIYVDSRWSTLSLYVRDTGADPALPAFESCTSSLHR